MVKLITLCATIIALLAGCSSAIVQPINKEAAATFERAQELAKRTAVPIAVSAPVISKRTDSWVPLKEVKGEDAKLPVEFSKTYSIDREFTAIAEVAERITFLSGIPVSISPDVLSMASQYQAGQTSTPTPPPVQGGPLPNATSAMPTGSVQLSYTGSLTGFMDLACARFGVSWEYRDGQVVIFRTITKTFVVYALPGDTTLDAKISNQSTGSSGSSSGSGGSTSTTASSNSTHSTGVSISGLSVWSALDQSIKGMLTSQGKVSVTPATGTLTVTDVPYVVARVGQFIDEQNKSLGRQVMINVRVLSVSLTDSDDYGINWNLVYNSVSNSLGASLASNFTPNVAASILRLSVLPSTKGTLGGSEAIISAISQQGNVSLVTSASVTTLNNQAVPVQVGRQTAYLASSSTTTTANVGSTTSITPGVVTTGFSMNLLPHVLEEGRLLLQYAIDISSLERLVTVSSGGSSIQTPEVQTRNFLQRVAVRSGETLVLSGFEQTENSASSQGVGSAQNTWLGGGVKGNKKRDVIVVLITPMVADRF